MGPRSFALVATSLLAALAPGAAAEPRVGVMTDVGVPDGLTLALATELAPRLVMHAGVAHNSAAPGGRAGLRLELLRAGVTPYLAAELGGFATGEATGWSRDLARSAGLEDAELDRVGYTFANAHLGLRLGGDAAALTLQAGWSEIRGTFYTIERRESGAIPTLELGTATRFRASSPSARIGLVAFF
jgi:hypothetical protein